MRIRNYLDFFFQAEDGIRDTSVTGVQTCALPISQARVADNPTRSAQIPRSLRFPTKRRWSEECSTLRSKPGSRKTEGRLQPPTRPNHYVRDWQSDRCRIGHKPDKQWARSPDRSRSRDGPRSSPSKTETAPDECEPAPVDETSPR